MGARVDGIDMLGLPTISRVQMSLLSGVFAVATMVVVAVQVTVPSESEIAAVGAEAGLPSLAPGLFNGIESLVRPAHSAHLETVFDDLGYRLEDVRDGTSVPRVYVTTLPRDLADLSSVEERKGLFLRSILPLVLMSNQELEHQRARVLDRWARMVTDAVSDVIEIGGRA